MKRIAFVCLGNICRSPLAEAVAKQKIKQNNYNLKCESFGTASWHIGEKPCKNSIITASSNNLDISNYKAQQITRDNINNYDFVIGLDASVVRDLKSLGYRGEVLLLGDFGYGGQDVMDPYFFPGLEGFDKVFDMIEKCIENFFNSEYFKKNM